MKFICAQPAIEYYTWQVEIMINNFIENKVDPNDIHILCSYSGVIPPNWQKLKEANKEVNFFFYQDLRQDRSYIPSIYFHLLKQHILAYPELEKETLFLHDSDILFTRPVDFKEMEAGDTWYLSDTVGYIGTQYILSKGEEVYNKMCKIMSIDPEIPKARNANSGGAQHIVKNTNYIFWDKVERDAVRLYTHFCIEEPKWQGKDHPIQKWTAGMWSLLWNAWMAGHETKVDKRLDFCWATDPIKRWEDCPIYHNAGVTVDRKDLFFKGGFIQQSPYQIKKEDYSDKFCSIKYVEQLLKTKSTSCLI